MKKSYFLMFALCIAGLSHVNGEEIEVAKNGSCSSYGCKYANQNNSNSNTDTMAEEDLMNQLSPDMQKVYENLTPEGKALALKLAGQSSYQDKNKAVKDAAGKLKKNLYNP